MISVKCAGRSAGGFTLLEAVVAIAIFSMAATAVYAWVNTNLMALEKVNNVYQRSSAIDSAVAFISTVDIVSRPEGSAELADMRIEWQGVPTQYAADVLDPQNAPTINLAQLYSVTVTIYLSGMITYQFQTNVLGLKKIRNLEDLIFG